jgi:predicted nucleic acid-binding protein
MSKIFFDADVLFSLVYSQNPLSGAKRVLLHGYLEEYSFITSFQVIEEVRKNLSAYNNPSYLKKLKELLEDFNFLIIKILNEKLINLYKNVVHQKDLHVLIAAIQAEADYLLTYNKKHFLTSKFIKLNLKLQIMNPKEFITKVILST